MFHVTSVSIAVLLLQILLCLTVLVVNDRAYAAKVNIRLTNVSKLKTNLSRARSVKIKSVYKEQSKIVTQNLYNSQVFNDNKDSISFREYDENGNPVIQLFVRREDTGHWLFFDELVANDEKISTTAIAVAEGGIEAEHSRETLDAWIALNIFGGGLGDPVALNKVKKKLPQFKKVKARFLQFGYSMAIEGDMVFPIKYHASNIKAKGNAMMGSSSSSTPIEPPSLVNLTSVLHQIENSMQSQDTGNFLQEDEHTSTILASLQMFLDACKIGNITDLFISADGSASFYGESNCLLASAGLHIFPSSSVTENTTVGTLSLDSQVASQPNESTPTTNIAKSGESIDTNNEPLSRVMPSLSIRVHSAAGAIVTPFDAEVVAGLLAVTIFRYLLDLIAKDNTKSTARDEMTSFFANGLFLSDSKTLCKFLKKRNVGIDELIVQQSKTKDISNRLAMWKLIRYQLETIDTSLAVSPSVSHIGIDSTLLSPFSDATQWAITAEISSMDGNRSSLELQPSHTALAAPPSTGTDNDTALSESLRMSLSADHDPNKSHHDKSDNKLQHSSLFQVEWVPGHPERRGITDINRWTMKDKAIWVADEIARDKQWDSIILSTPTDVNHARVGAIEYSKEAVISSSPTGFYHPSTVLEISLLDLLSLARIEKLD